MVIAILILIIVMAAIVWWKFSMAWETCADMRKHNVWDVRKCQKVRVALMMGNSVLLSIQQEGKKYDLAVDSIVGKDESVEGVLARLPLELGADSLPDVRFCLKHNSICRNSKCVSYLFVLHLDNANAGNVNFKDAVWWAFEDIAPKLGKGVFNCEFEEEFPHLEMVHGMWKITEGSGVITEFEE